MGCEDGMDGGIDMVGLGRLVGLMVPVGRLR